MRSVVVLMLCGLSTAAVASPVQLTHQGRIIDSLGAPVSGTSTVVVGLYDASSASTPVWSESFPNTSVEGGYYSVTLGAGTTSLDSDLFASGAGLWVQTTVDGTPMLPRTQLTNVPHAITAERLSGPDDAVLSGSSVTAGATATTSVSLAQFAGPRLATVAGAPGALVSVNGGPAVGAAVVNSGDSLQLSLPDAPVGNHTVQLVVGSTIYTWDVEATAVNATCKTLLDAGIATSDGAQTIDPDGPGGAAPYSVWCDIGNGGWTYAAENTPFTVVFTGTPQTVTTPIVPTTYEWTLYGAAGGGKGYPAQNAVQHGAAGGMAKGRRTFDPLTPLYVYVGGEGTPSDIQDNDGCQNLVGGWNGGGRASRGAASGGGATDLRLRLGDLYSRILVAGGGGGCGYGGIGCEFAGGVGGGLVGGNGSAHSSIGTGGRGGTQTAGGLSPVDSYSNGSFGKGGDAAQCNDEGGGGGGWYGGSGGGRDNNTGGGGSSYVDGMDSDTSTTSGTNQRNGRATYIFQ